MPAVGFGQNVTGGDNANNPLVVTNEGGATLAAALDEAKSRSKQGKKTKIVIDKNVTIFAASDDKPLIVKASDLTIEGRSGSVIDANQLYFDCTRSDNVILRNLTFGGRSTDKRFTTDAIFIDALQGRGSKGFWIDHCHFEAYYDLNITVKAADVKRAGPLFLTVSSCSFHDIDPNGALHRNNGAIGIDGPPENNETNIFATVCRNLFQTVRRRSPRSAERTYVHAFNNVLLKWGATDTDDDQINGMASGHNGRLVAEANYFFAGPVKEAIQVSVTSGEGGRLTVHESDDVLQNMYENGATPATTAGNEIDINAKYRTFSVTVPTVIKMSDSVMTEIRNEAGPQFTT